MMGLSDGRKSLPIGLAVLIQYRSVTDTQPPSQPPSHVAVAITLNPQASSLKSSVAMQCEIIDFFSDNMRRPFLILTVKMLKESTETKDIAKNKSGPSFWDTG